MRILIGTRQGIAGPRNAGLGIAGSGIVGRGIAAAVLCAGLMLFTACSSSKNPPAPQPVSHAAPAPPATKLAPPTPIQEKRVELGGETWNPDWDQLVEKSLPADLLSTQVPRDVRHFCPRFYQLSEVDKRAFWAYFFQALAGAEAGLKPTSNVRHTEPEVAVRDRVTGQIAHQEGLLQLRYEDAVRYGCDFDWDADRKLPAKDPEKTILQPKNNLLCGVRILDNQLIALHKPLVTPTSYWSTLHPGTESYRVFAKQMINPPAACGLHAVAPRRARQAPASTQQQNLARASR